MNGSLYESAFTELSSRKEDIKPSDIVLFSEPLRSAINFVVRLGRFNLTDFAGKLGFTREQAKNLADILVERKLFTVKPNPSDTDEIFYEARLSAPARAPVRKSVDLWSKLD